jgi:hypothetical protein
VNRVDSAAMRNYFLDRLRGARDLSFADHREFRPGVLRKLVFAIVTTIVSTTVAESARPRTAKELEDTRRLMGALVRMKPKPHEDMKVGKKKKKSKPKKGSGK